MTRLNYTTYNVVKSASLPGRWRKEGWMFFSDVLVRAHAIRGPCIKYFPPSPSLANALHALRRFPRSLPTHLPLRGDPCVSVQRAQSRNASLPKIRHCRRRGCGRVGLPHKHLDSNHPRRIGGTPPTCLFFHRRYTVLSRSYCKGFSPTTTPFELQQRSG